MSDDDDAGARTAGQGGTPKVEPHRHGAGRAGGAPRPSLRLRCGVALLLVLLGVVAGVVAAAAATPSWAASSQVLLRERDYAAIVFGQTAVASTNTPQRTVAAQVLAAQSPAFANLVAARASVDPATVPDRLTVTASPDADVVVFSATGPDEGQVSDLANAAAAVEVDVYQNQLVTGLASGGGSGLDATQQAQLAQIRSFEQLSPSVLIIAGAGTPTGGPVSKVTGVVAGGAAGVVIAFLLLAGESAWRSRRRRGPSTRS